MAEPAPIPVSAPLRGRLRHAVPLAPYTSWRVGGPADELYEPVDRADLLAFLARRPAAAPVLWVGLGSNLLVRDGGVRGTVVVLHGHLAELELERPASAGDAGVIRAGAGVHCARVAKFAERQDLAGLGFMNGIPGTVGGALAMNAGAFGSETWPQVVAAEALFADGSVRWLEPAAFRIAYRTVIAPAGFRGFLGARFAVRPDDGRHRAATREHMARRKATQPVGHPSGGSTFRNPTGDHAARLIEAAGLKGTRIGGAQVSTQHANFILNDGAATAADIEALIGRVQAEVQARFGVVLEPEVRIVGEALAAGGDHA
ncbi:MAG: UDP-N-acetylmuramate dehydrogenase [Nevskiaceae bacterium]|nr:MAG: UDP-N-acetylmuramate dehydrogenase [Nevskiaceae bacterium]TBR73386.1 MAG: UDP-N-acetylmuramate dehydrogenase [Nevskiaceae bacterium]